MQSKFNKTTIAKKVLTACAFTAVLAISSIGAKAQISSASITVNPAPTASPITDTTFCNGFLTSPILLAGTPSGVTFDISGGTAIGLNDQTGVTSIPAFTAVNAGTANTSATITVTPKANGCPNGTPVTFVINVVPAVSVTATSDIIACAGTSVTVPAFTGTPAAAVFNWSNNTTSIGLAATGTGDIASFNGINAGTADVVADVAVTPSVTLNGVTCTGTDDNFTITVRPTPNGTIAGDVICQGTPAELTFTATAGTAPFHLEIKEGSNTAVAYPGIISGGAVAVTPVPTTTTTYDLMKITDANGCVKQ